MKNTTGFFDYTKQNTQRDDINGLVLAETKRLIDVYEKNTLGYKEVQEILSISKNAAIDLLHSNSFPTIKIGNRRSVPALAFVMWELDLSAK